MEIRTQQRRRSATNSNDFPRIPSRFRYLFHHPIFRRFPLRTAVRLLLWRLRCLLGWGAQIDLPRWGARFYLPPRWGGQGTTMIFATREDYEVELTHLDRFLFPGATVVDAGASCGIYTIAAAKLVGDTGRVIAFEPGERSAAVLERNVELNELTNVRLHRVALADRSAVARLYHHRAPVASSIAAGQDEGESVEVPTVTLREALESEGLEGLDFLKMDIEGAEELALRGAEPFLSRSHPVVVFEMNPIATSRFGLAVDGAWRHLEALEYEFFEFDGDGRLRPLAAPPTDTDQEFRNIVAVHPSARKRQVETAGTAVE